MGWRGRHRRVIPATRSELRSACSVAVPPSTPILWLASDCRSWGPVARIIRLAPSTKVGIERSTNSRRARRLTQKVRLMLLNPREAVGSGDRNIRDGQRGQVQLIRELLGDFPVDRP